MSVSLTGVTAPAAGVASRSETPWGIPTATVSPVGAGVSHARREAMPPDRSGGTALLDTIEPSRPSEDREKTHEAS